MAEHRRYTDAEIAAALEHAHGLVSVAARALGCSVPTIHNHIRRSGLVREALRSSREALLDNAEMALYNQVLAGEGWAVCFLLKCLGKERGYVEHRQLRGAAADGATSLRRLREVVLDAHPESSGLPANLRQGEAKRQ